MGISRRDALLGTLAGGLSACATSGSQVFTGLTPVTNAAFRHGVASGDPYQESVVLWTRVESTLERFAISAEVAEDKEFSRIVRSYIGMVERGKDHTVKVIADGLEPGKTYYYRFQAGETYSPIGRTKTLPEETSRVKFAVGSCSNYPFGYFNAYDHMARLNDIDAVLHLGDYLYEYGPDGYGSDVGKQLGRIHAPTREMVNLKDYRQRHAQYKSDPGTQAMHAAHPMISIWDDHETTNDSFKDGAENHQPETEGDWTIRKNAALQAYYEWMPIREPEPGKPREALFRDFSWGKFMSLSALESRLMARTEPLDYANFGDELKTEEGRETIRREIITDPSRELLGDAQLAYFDKVIRQSVNRGDTWRVVANQVIMAQIVLPDVSKHVTEEQIVEFEKKWDRARAFVNFTKLGMPFNLDAWDGYPAARQRFYEMVQNAGARDLIVLTGDTHEAWGNDLYADDDTKMGVELGTAGITSPGFFSYLGEGAAFDFSLLMRRDNRDVRFHDPVNKGYFTLTLNEDEGWVDYIGLSTVLSPNYEAFSVASLDIVKRNGSLEFGKKRGLGFKERVVFAAD